MHHPRKRISLLVPFHDERNTTDRREIWRWLKRYWQHRLPDAEIVMGHNGDHPFSKTRAVNNAARRATGDIFVILDSDAFINATVVSACAERIRRARALDHPLWFIPYRHIYRLTQETSADLLDSDPCEPLHFPSPPPPEDVESTLGSMHGHRFGALIQIMPREAFELCCGMDPRFAGWGGEDIAFVRALDTLFGSHKTTNNDVLHIWHDHIGISHKTRMWEGQSSPRSNELLASRYNRATGDRVRMRALVDEGCRAQRRWFRRSWEVAIGWARAAWQWTKQMYRRVAGT